MKNLVPSLLLIPANPNMPMDFPDLSSLIRRGFSMKTEIMIDHRVWKNWRESDEDSAIVQLNNLLKPHGVQLSVDSEDHSDFIEITATSTQSRT